MNNQKIQDLISKAEKLEKKKTIWDYFGSYTLLDEKYETIADLYEKAANIARISNQELAIGYYIKSCNWLLKSTNEFNQLKIKNLFATIGDLYLNIDTTRSIEYYNKVIEYYLDKGDLHLICKIYSKIANIYMDTNNLTQALETFEKIISIGTNDSSFNIIITKTNQSIGSIYIKQFEYSKASDIYWSIGTEQSSNKHTYGAKKHFLTSILCACAANNLEKAKLLHNKLLEQDYTYLNSPQGKFIEKLLDLIDKCDIEAIGYLAYQYDSIHLLDSELVQILLEIKNILTSSESNLDQDIDLS